jgi:hypothetical protein
MTMAKGQKKSNKETRKPKQAKAAPTSTANDQTFANLKKAQQK